MSQASLEWTSQDSHINLCLVRSLRTPLYNDLHSLNWCCWRPGPPISPLNILSLRFLTCWDSSGSLASLIKELNHQKAIHHCALHLLTLLIQATLRNQRVCKATPRERTETRFPTALSEFGFNHQRATPWDNDLKSKRQNRIAQGFFLDTEN